MEIAIVIFLGLWVTACSLLAYTKVRRDLKNGTERGDGQK